MEGTLLHSPARILSRSLIGRSYGTAPVTSGVYTSSSWPIFVGREPDLPDNCITIRNTTGVDFGFNQYSGQRNEHQGVQIRVRSHTEEEGFVKARAIAVALDESIVDDAVLLDGSYYLLRSVDRRGDVISLGKEAPQSQRSLFTINATTVLEKTASAIATSEGALFPGTATNINATGASWSNINNVKVSDGIGASVLTDPAGGDALTDIIQVTNFGFNIPMNSTVIGVEAAVRRFRTFNSPPPTITATDVSVRLRKSSGVIGDNKADTSTDWPVLFGVKTYGGLGDIWGATWTPAEVNHQDFGLRFQAKSTCLDGASFNYQLFVDYITLTVYYVF